MRPAKARDVDAIAQQGSAGDAARFAGHQPTDAAWEAELDRLAESLIEHLRRGEAPSVAAYARSHPELADKIREYFPRILRVEEACRAPLASADPAASAGAAPASPYEVPERLGEYRIVRKLGRGGMGIVYEAVQESLGRRVALKVLPYHSLLDPTRLERFRNEARAAAALDHENIVPVYAVGEHHGIHFFVMQLIEGRSLESLIFETRSLRDAGGAEGDLPNLLARADSDTDRIRCAARVGFETAQALAFAHREGILHRDIKPANLLLDARGKIWVADFGLAKAVGGDDLTGSGEFPGTLRYMSPERFRGWSDPRSDVYSLGITLYELLTLRPAFDARDREHLVEQICRREPVPPRRIDPRISQDLETVVLEAIAKEPGERYQSAEELAEDLRRVLADEPIRASPITRTMRVWRWCRRNRKLAALSATLIAVLLVAAVASCVGWMILRERSWQSYLGQAQASHWSRRPGRRFESLELIAKAAAIRPTLELRNEAISGLGLVDVRLARTLPLGSHAFVAFDPELELGAFSDEQGNSSVIELATGRELARLPGTGARIWRGTFSRDRRYLAVRYHRPAKDEARCRVWDLETSQVLVDEFVGNPGGAVEFALDASWVALGKSSGEFVLFRLPAASVWKAFTSDANPYGARLHPGGDLLAVSSSATGNVKIWDLRSDAVVNSLAHPRGAYGLDWHPSGEMLAVASADQKIHIWDVRSAREFTGPRELSGHQAPVIDVTFSHRGELLASRAWDTTTRIWDPWSGRELVAIAGSWPEPRFSRDDSLLAGTSSEERSVAVWEVASAHECRSFEWRPKADLVADVDIHRDDRLLVVAGAPGLRFWDLVDGREIGSFALPGTMSAFFRPTTGDLYASGTYGIKRWSIAVRDDSGVVELGGEQLVHGPMPGRSIWSSVSADGRWAVLVAQSSEALLFDLETATVRTAMPHPSMGAPTISPAGDFAATGNRTGKDVRIWSVPEGRLLEEIPIAGNAIAAFSPDGCWLVVAAGGRFEIREVPSWKIRHTLSTDFAGSGVGSMAFSPDGSVLALAPFAAGVKLVAPSTGAELATLGSPVLEWQTIHDFSSDGGWLSVVTAHGRIHVWDLRRVRSQLREMRLDWEPAFPRTPSPPETAPPLRGLVDASGRMLDSLAP